MPDVTTAESNETSAPDAVSGHDESGWAAVRDLWSLDPAFAHLNHGSFGAPPDRVIAAQRAWQHRMSTNPVSFFRRELPTAVDDARRRTAAFVNADPEGFAFVTNVTAGTSAVLASLRLDSGAEILVTDHAYGAVRFAVERACRRANARIVTAPIELDASDDEIVAALARHAGPHTALAVVDHVTSPTARRFPVERVIPALRERGVPVLVDAAHAPGMLPVDLTELDPDFWTDNFHKWACAPHGCAGLYAAPRHRARLASLAVSWAEPLGFPHSFTMVGTADLSAWLAAPEVFDAPGAARTAAGSDATRFLGAVAWSELRRRNTELVAYGQRAVATALGVDPATLPGDEGVSMRCVPLPPGAARDRAGVDALTDRIADELHTHVAVNLWRDQPLLRLSAQAYNRPAEYDALAAALPALLATLA